LWRVLKQPEGMKTDESVYHKIRCSYEEQMGDLVLTDRGVTYLQIKGILGDRHERLHEFGYNEIDRIRTKKKQSGIYRHGIMIGQEDESSLNHQFYYSCEKHKAVLFHSLFERQKLLLETPGDMTSTIQSLEMIKRNADLLKVAKNPKLRPYFFAFALDKLEDEILTILKYRFEVDLFELAGNKDIHSLVALLHETDTRKIPKDQVYYTVTDLVHHLISQGDLEGIVTELGTYVSNKALDRIPAQYDDIADFKTIFSQLNEKGVLVWALECPACSRKIKYPKMGKNTTCQFCGETIYARDVLKKFVDLL
jgi:hypothetical protein